MKNKLGFGWFVLAVLLCCQGCETLLGPGKVGKGVVGYGGGELRAVEPASLDRVWTAIEEAVSDLNLVKVKNEKDGLGAVMEVRGAGDKRVTIKLSSQGEKSTELQIRVGFIGEEVYSRQLYEKIRSHY